MGNNTLWLILIDEGGSETGRITIGDQARHSLPIRRIVEEGLRFDAAAVIIARGAADRDCTPCHKELLAIDAARRALGPIGLRLHDYILWHDETCASLRLTGQL